MYMSDDSRSLKDDKEEDEEEEGREAMKAENSISRFASDGFSDGSEAWEKGWWWWCSAAGGGALGSVKSKGRGSAA
jgi:hypothetical protein